MKSDNALYRLTGWLLSTSLFAAACALALTLATEKLLTGGLLLVFSPLHLLVVGCTLAEYNVHFLLHSGGFFAGKGLSSRTRGWHWLFAIAGAAMCLIALPSLPRNLIVFLAVLGAMSLIYSAPNLPFRPKRKINDYGVTKILVLTATWVCVTTIFPALFLKQVWNAAGPEVLWRSLLIFPLCLAFDLRDFAADREDGVQTLAGALGEKWSYRLIYFILFALIIIAAFYFRNATATSFSQAVSLLISPAAAILAVRYSRARPHQFVYLGLIDGVMLLYGVVYLIT